MKITYLTEEHMDCLASEVYARMDDEINPELIHDFISELIGQDADE